MSLLILCSECEERINDLLNNQYANDARILKSEKKGFTQSLRKARASARILLMTANNMCASCAEKNKGVVKK